ncbi:MAG: RluA family pseudouridine synthase [Patescibacteria group bacterium]|nr:RluA family pseudouridine synthase [Patescibacteria group bacterium]
MDIPILFEDDGVVVVDKPPGIMVHGDGRDRREGAQETVADWHVARLPETRGVGEPLSLSDGTQLNRPGVVHRLDQETSGVLILAKTPEAFAHLKKQFHDRLAKKEYRAFVYEQVKEPRGVIRRAIGRSAQDFRLYSAQRGTRGRLREAETSWERISISAQYSYLRLLPKTGRRHQLRVHTKAINHPILCDRLYAPKRVARDPHALGFTRLALHAYALSIALSSRELRTFIAPLPEDFTRAERLLKGSLL